MMELTKAFSKEKIWRIIPSIYPPIDLFERVASPEDFKILYEIEAMTNPRLENEIGNLELISVDDMVFGNGAGYIMAAFTHLNPQGSRFSDGTFGVYYAGKTLDCAISETKHHREKFYRYTSEEAFDLDMRVLVAELNGVLHDITDQQKSLPEIYNPDNYSASQTFAKKLGKAGSNGIYYSSIRHKDGYCYALFKPKTITKCKQERHLIYRWNGKCIEHIFETKERKF